MVFLTPDLLGFGFSVVFLTFLAESWDGFFFVTMPQPHNSMSWIPTSLSGDFSTDSTAAFKVMGLLGRQGFASYMVTCFWPLAKHINRLSSAKRIASKNHCYGFQLCGEWTGWAVYAASLGKRVIVLLKFVKFKLFTFWSGYHSYIISSPQKPCNVNLFTAALMVSGSAI